MNLYPLRGALIAVVLLTGCGDRSDWGGDKGPVMSEHREVKPFDSIEMEGAAKLEITIGEPVSVQLSGHEKAVRRMETEVRGHTLHIKGRARDWMVRDNSSRLTLQITLPRLESLEIEGGNDVRLVGLHGGKTRIKAAGAVNINAEGQLDELTVRMMGAGHADLGKLATTDADVTVEGVGNLIVNASNSLDATMNGVGAIFYVGTPKKVNSRMNGLGTIAQMSKDDDSDEDDSEVEPGTDQQSAPVDPDSLQPELEGPKTQPVNSKPGHIIAI